MNKFKFLLVAAFITVSTAALAQKTGYISVDQVISIMPEVTKIDSQLQKFQADTVNAEFASLIEQYNYKDSILNKTDTLKMPASLRKQYRNDLEGIAYQVQNWQAISQQAVQNKQNQLLAPVYRKVMAAIQSVAKEKGYTYIYDKSVLILGPNADDLLPAVAQKLKITVPKEMQIGLQ
jgi:outer membrane protein